jgi:hypothetical protein
LNGLGEVPQSHLSPLLGTLSVLRFRLGRYVVSEFPELSPNFALWLLGKGCSLYSLLYKDLTFYGISGGDEGPNGPTAGEVGADGGGVDSDGFQVRAKGEQGVPLGHGQP